jgi:hypothetical protein
MKEKRPRMKPRRLTRFEKECCEAQGANPKYYLFAYTINDSYFKIVHKETGVQKTIDVYRRKSRWGM